MIREILIPIYNATVKFVMSDDIDKEMAKHCDSIGDDEEAMTIWFEDSHYYVMGIRKDMFKQETLTHECSHLAHRIMNSVGIGASLLDDEAEAYLIGYLAGEIVNMAYEELDADWLAHTYMKNFPL